ncbi:MAG: EVE domain-containing protein [Verrucomicrobiales bacterium]|nr:EVE domain-containing protein [Verrucomicrobiales bacterium]
MNHWLFKSEPDVFSFSDLRQRAQPEPWSGVRNYQARNFMRDQMTPGDLGFFYHSSCPEPGIAGVLRVASKPYPDPTQFEAGGEYFDPKSTPEKPRWQLVDVAWEADLSTFVSLEKLRSDPKLTGMVVLQRGSRLSITPVSPNEFRRICQMGGLKR